MRSDEIRVEYRLYAFELAFVLKQVEIYLRPLQLVSRTVVIPRLGVVLVVFMGLRERKLEVDAGLIRQR